MRGSQNRARSQFVVRGSQNRARSQFVVPSSWEEGSGVVEINKVRLIIIIWCVNRLCHYSSLPPLARPAGALSERSGERTPRPPSRMGIRSPLWGRSHIDGCSKGPSRPGGGDYAGRLTKQGFLLFLPPLVLRLHNLVGIAGEVLQQLIGGGRGIHANPMLWR